MFYEIIVDALGVPINEMQSNIAYSSASALLLLTGLSMIVLAYMFIRR